MVKTYSLETTIIDIYKVTDDILGITCNSGPATLNEAYRGSSYYKNSIHKQHDDLYLKMDDPKYNEMYDKLQIGNTVLIKYNKILCEHFDDSENYKRERDAPFNLKDTYDYYKIKTKHYTKRMYANYIVNVLNCPTYKLTIRVEKVLKNNITGCYEIQPEDFTGDRFLIHTDDRHLFKINKKYKIYFKKTTDGLNYYTIVRYEPR